MAKPSKLAHVVYMTRRFDEMIEWDKAVFGAEAQYRNPLTKDLEPDSLLINWDIVLEKG